jgi:hypothetical protein
MNSNKLISIDDADLDQVAGGLGISLGLDSRLLGKAGAGLSLGFEGIEGTITLFGKTVTAGLGVILDVSDAG